MSSSTLSPVILPARGVGFARLHTPLVGGVGGSDGWLGSTVVAQCVVRFWNSVLDSVSVTTAWIVIVSVWVSNSSIVRASLMVFVVVDVQSSEQS